MIIQNHNKIISLHIIISHISVVQMNDSRPAVIFFKKSTIRIFLHMYIKSWVSCNACRTQTIALSISLTILCVILYSL